MSRREPQIRRRPLTKEERALCLELADRNLNLSATARALGVKRSTVDWQIDLIYRATELDARNFYDLCELLEQIREGSL